MSTDKASSKKFVLFLDITSLNIAFSISVLVLEVCSPILPLSTAVFLRLHVLFLYLLAAFLMVDEWAVPNESMPEKSEAAAVAAVAEEVVHESVESKDAVSETKDDEFDEFNDRQYFDDLFVQSFLFKITYGVSTVKRFVAPIVNGSFAFDMSDLKEKIKYLFNFPIHSELELTYIDEHCELITMTDDEDLMDIMTQMTLPYLRMYVKVINIRPPVQVGAGLKHTGTSKSTKHDEFSELDDQQNFGDWFLDHFLLKIRYGQTQKRFVAPTVNGSFVFGMSGLKDKIKYLFNLPNDSELLLRYIDEHNEMITMTDDNDLEDIMMQMTLPNLRIYVDVLNIAPPVQLGGGGTGLKHADTSKSTNTWESDSPANSDEDDWFLY
ncbi:uncharacterized protein LOC141716631 [Apium graveolens]|uniref:uncharacterized protein LOC141716631 n=1 Tax=Apium graveolens TaxID=4045 RepID=UPI003D78D523